MTRTCRQCKIEKPIGDFKADSRDATGRSTQCKACFAAAMKARRADGRYDELQREGRRRHNLKQFGLTVEQYDAMLERQGGVCGMCRQACATGRRLAVDHDHQTGRVRGLLCHRCNRGLGAYELHRENAERYLKTGDG